MFEERSRRRRQNMRDRWFVIIGAILFAGGAVGAAVWLWVKRRQLVLAAAKAVPEQAAAATAERASAVTHAIPEQASAITNAAQEQAAPVTNGIPERRPSGQ